jgi:hypothetical protein
MVVVRSNHDDFLDRWLMGEDWRKASNKAMYLKYASILAQGKAPKGIIPYYLEKNFDNVIALSLDDSYRIGDFECAIHGHIGASGSRGSMTQFKNLNTKNKEGFIFRFHPSNFRMKIKFEEYVRLHRIMTSCSTTSVWEALSNGMDIDDIIKDVPDEFYGKIKDYVKELNYNFHSVKERAGKLFDNLYESYNGELPEKSKYAHWVKQFDKELHPILFRMYDNKDYSEYIWKLIKPEFKKL